MTNEKFENLGTVPLKCHMWKQNEPDLDLEEIKKYQEGGYTTYADESIRSLKKCLDCGQLYFYEMVEMRDMDEGSDPVYRTYIPIASEEIADKLAKASELKIPLHTPRIQQDWAQDGKKTFRWFKK